MRCHSTPGPEYRGGPGPAPRPHAPGPGRSHRGVQTWATPHTRRRFLTAGTEIPASSFRQVIPAPLGSDPGPRATASRFSRPASSAPALSETVGTRPRPPTRPSYRGSARSAGPARRWLLALRGPRRLGGASPRDQDTGLLHPPSPRPPAPSLTSDSGRALFLLHRRWDQHVLPGSSLKRWKNSSLELRRGAAGSGRE